MPPALLALLARLHNHVQPWPVLGPLARVGARAFFATRAALDRWRAEPAPDALATLVDGLCAAVQGASLADQALAARLAALEATLADLRAAIQGAETNEQSLRQAAQALETRQAAGLEALARRLDAAFQGLGRVEARVEFAREETLFELRRALRLTAPGAGATIATRVLNPQRVQAHAGRVNLGCGHLPRPDMINVDARDLPGVDIVADVAALPFAPGSLQVLHAAHLLEHFPRRALLDVILPHWRALLAPGGVLELIVPDAPAMLAAHQRGAISFDDLALVTFGAQDYDGDFHYAMHGPDSLRDLLAAAGFARIDLVASDRVNGKCREMELHATLAAPSADPAP